MEKVICTNKKCKEHDIAGYTSSPEYVRCSCGGRLTIVEQELNTCVTGHQSGLANRISGIFTTFKERESLYALSLMLDSGMESKQNNIQKEVTEYEYIAHLS